MARFALGLCVLCLASALAGCADGDWESATRFPDSGAAPPPAPLATPVRDISPAAPVPAQLKCERAASDRAVDAVNQGFPEMSQEVHDKTYSECLTWNRRGE